MTLQEQERNDIQLADWIIKRALGTQDAFDQNMMICWTESGQDRLRKLILGAFKSARRNTAQPSCVPNIDTQRLDWLEKNCFTNREGEREIHYDFRGPFREAIDKAMASNNPPAEK